tara:strand:- start:3916 stop:5628 length:1713 start_codon:yes stop_codon:yes gene_type:complete
MSLWSSKDTIPIEQTEKSISSTNGLSYSAGQVIDIFVPPSTKFFVGKDSYLEFDVEIALPSDSAGDLTRIQLDAETGGNVLIKTLSLFAGHKSQLLEQIVAYNTMVAIKYDYETNDTLKGKRIVEGCTMPIADLRGSNGTTESSLNNHKSNPYYKKVDDATTTTEFTNANFYQKAKITIPIHCGVFSSDKVWPNMLVNGCTLSLELESNTNVFRMLDSVSKERRIKANPRVNGLGAVDGTLAASGSETKEVFIQPDNSCFKVENFPFVVGQKFKLTSATYTDASLNAGTISQIEVDSDYVKVTTSASLVATGAVDPTTTDFFLVDESVVSAASFEPSYTVSDCKLVLKEVNMGSGYENDLMSRMKQSGVINIDVNSVHNYQSSILASDRVANIRVPVNNSRCRSVIASLTDSTRYAVKDAISASGTYEFSNATGDSVMRSCRSGLEGLCDQLSEYNWFLNGRLQPSRPVKTSKIADRQSISAQHIVEIEKSLASSGFIEPLSFEAYNRNFIIGRTLGIQNNMVYDARGKDFNLQLNYNESAAPIKNKLVNMFVFHIRRFVIKNESVMVVP